MDISIVALSEVRRLDGGEIMAGGYTYYWYGHFDGYHAQGVAVAVSNKLTPMIIEVTLCLSLYLSIECSLWLPVASLVGTWLCH